ncbi:MAG: hypothetical protein LJE60_07335 [Thiocapsa sp.]|nr:hypothetical protein [Thiocapsa sp.]MCG6896904.1 hypothetical protein [Thiocapsa sp.]
MTAGTEVVPASRGTRARRRGILTSSVLLYLALAARPDWSSDRPLRDLIDEPALIYLLLCVAVPAYLWRSPLVADVLRDCADHIWRDRT